MPPSQGQWAYRALVGPLKPSWLATFAFPDCNHFPFIRKQAIPSLNVFLTSLKTWLGLLVLVSDAIQQWFNPKIAEHLVMVFQRENGEAAALALSVPKAL